MSAGKPVTGKLVQDAEGIWHEVKPTRPSRRSREGRARTRVANAMLRAALAGEPVDATTWDLCRKAIEDGGQK